MEKIIIHSRDLLQFVEGLDGAQTDGADLAGEVGREETKV